MARQKAKTLEEKIKVNETDISLAKEKLNELHEERKELLERKKNEDLKLLIQALEITGIDIEQAVTIIKENATKENTDNTKSA